MLPVSAGFAAAMLGDHTMHERAMVVDADGGTVAVLSESDGRVVESAGAMIRHSGSVTVSGLSAAGDLSRGVVVRLDVGVEVDGDIEWVPEITGHVTVPDRAARGSVTVDLLDAMSLCQRRSLTTTVIPGATPTVDAIIALLRRGHPGLSIASVMSSAHVVEQLVYPPLTDLAEHAAQAAEAIGAVAWVDRVGRLVISPRPSPANSPVIELAQDSRCVSDARVTEPDPPVPNIVVVTAQHSAAGEFMSIARTGDWRSDPRVWEVPTEKAITQRQCDDMALGLLAQAQAGSQEVVIQCSSSMVHLEAGDNAQLRFPDWDIDGTFSLHTRERPRGGTATLTFRRGVQFDDQALA